MSRAVHRLCTTTNGLALACVTTHVLVLVRVITIAAAVACLLGCVLTARAVLLSPPAVLRNPPAVHRLRLATAVVRPLAVVALLSRPVPLRVLMARSMAGTTVATMLPRKFPPRTTLRPKLRLRKKLLRLPRLKPNCVASSRLGTACVRKARTMAANVWQDSLLPATHLRSHKDPVFPLGKPGFFVGFAYSGPSRRVRCADHDETRSRFTAAQSDLSAIPRKPPAGESTALVLVRTADPTLGGISAGTEKLSCPAGVRTTIEYPCNGSRGNGNR